MEINYDLFDQVYAKLEIEPIDNIIEKSAIAMKLFNILTGTMDTLIKLPNPDDMSQYLLPCILAASQVNQSPKPIILVLSGYCQQHKAIEMESDISGILNSMGVTQSITKTIVRGGKENYLCRRRYFDFIRSITGSRNQLAAKLIELGVPYNIDLSGNTGLTHEEKRKICVMDCNPRCAYYQSCAYVEHFKRSGINRHMLQVLDPYFFTKQILSCYKNGGMYFPGNATAIIPDPGSLEKAAKSIFTRKFARNSVPRFVSVLLTATIGNKAHHQRVRKTCERLENNNNVFFDLLERSSKSDRVGESLFKMLIELQRIQNICSTELNKDYKLKNYYDFLLGVLGDCVTSDNVYKITTRPNGVEISITVKFLHKELIQAMKYAPIQVVILSGE